MQKTTLAMMCLCIPAVLSSNSVWAQAPSPENKSLATSEQGKQSEAESNEDENSKKTNNFGERLKQRKISEYGQPNRALFNNALDVSVGLGQSANDNLFGGQRVTTKSTTVSTGINNSVGISLSLSESLGRAYASNGGSYELVNKTHQHGVSGSLNYRLLNETPELPEIYLSGSLGKVFSTTDRTTQGLSLNFSRRLESASLYSYIDYGHYRGVDGISGTSRTVGGAFLLTVNHRLALSTGYNIGTTTNDINQSNLSGSVIYRAWPEWVLRGNVSRQLTGALGSSASMDVTRTFKP